MPIKILFSILIIISCSCVEESETSDDVSEFSFKSENTPFEALQVLDIHFRSHKPAQPILVSAQNDRLFVFDKEDNSLKEYGFTNSTFIFRKSLLSIASDDRANRLTSSKNGLVLSTSSCIYVVLNDGIINKYDNSYGIYGMALNDNNTALYVYNYNGVPKKQKNSLFSVYSIDLFLHYSMGSNIYTNLWANSKLFNSSINLNNPFILVSNNRSNSFILFNTETGKQKTITPTSKVLARRKEYNMETTSRFCSTYSDSEIINDFIVALSPDFNSQYLLIYNFNMNVEKIFNLNNNIPSTVLDISIGEFSNSTVFLLVNQSEKGSYINFYNITIS